MTNDEMWERIELLIEENITLNEDVERYQDQIRMMEHVEALMKPLVGDLYNLLLLGDNDV